MSGKNQYPSQLNWQSTNPATGFLPNPNQCGSVPSGVTSGTMTGTTTIYSNIIDVSKMDNAGIEIAWTGTAVGTISILGSNSGVNFPALTFSPALTQPAGTAGSYLINLNQFPFKYLMVQYVNASSTGTLSAYCQFKDLN